MYISPLIRTSRCRTSITDMTSLLILHILLSLLPFYLLFRKRRRAELQGVALNVYYSRSGIGRMQY